MLLCHALGLSYDELQRQPAWWVQAYQALLSGKNHAEEVEQKRASSQR